MANQLLILGRTVGLLAVTAIAEIVGCFLPYLWLRQGKSVLLLLPAAASLATFSWLLTLHPFGAGRTYAAYGGVYVATAIVWLWLVERQRPDRWDLIGVAICLIGMAIIVLAPRR
jgi:small multidrug resistance family-3 protein